MFPLIPFAAIALSALFLFRPRGAAAGGAVQNPQTAGEK